MALLELNLYSNVLGMNCRVHVILPQKKQEIGLAAAAEKEAERWPVLWLLHGASDDDTSWLRRTSIERYVSSMGLAVVMPSVHLSMYANMVHGGRYMDYVAEELPEILYQMLPLSDRREDNYIAGQSMGGYGSMKIGLTFPERYAAIGCFSSGNFIHLGRLDKPEFGSRGADRNRTVFGVDDMKQLAGTEHDLFELARRNLEKKPSALPGIYHVCGDQDFLLDIAREMRDWFEKNGKQYDYSYREGPGGHEWDFWDVWIQDFLKWLAEKK